MFCFFFLLAIIMCLSMLHEVGHFLELNVGAGNVLWRERECVETTPLMSKGLHERGNDKISEEKRTTEERKCRARWFLLQVVC